MFLNIKQSGVGFGIVIRWAHGFENQCIDLSHCCHAWSLITASFEFLPYKFLSADGTHEVVGKEKEELHQTAEDDHFGPKCYYDKAKSFFDNISSDKKFR